MWLYVIIGIGAVLALGIIVAGVAISRQGDTATQERLGQFVGGRERGEGGEEGEARVSGPSTLTQNLDEVFERRGVGKGLATELARADLKLTVAEFYALTLISMLGTAAVAWLIYRGWVLPMAAFMAGFFFPKIYLKFRQKARLKRFNSQLGDAITLMANGLRSGYSLLQAMDAVGREMPDPIALECRRVVQEVGLGINLERAFQNLLRRVPSDDLDLMITAINVQHEVGGNLAEILEIIAFVIRERIRIKGQIAVLTAQGQLSGYVISFLPIALGLILYAMNQKYIGRMVFPCPADQELCSQPCGWIMIGVGLIMIASGFFAIQKIIDIDV
jgi:tight adherence protein B